MLTNNVSFLILQLLGLAFPFTISNPIPEDEVRYPNCPLAQRAITEQSKLVKERTIDTAAFSTCGIPPSHYRPQPTNTSYHMRSAGGAAAQADGWPWIAYVYNLTTCRFVCGGTLLSNKWILSAASCFPRETNGPVKYGIVFGMYRTESNSDVEIHRIASSVSVHPGYRRGNNADNVAMIKLANPVEFTLHVRPACVPPYGADTDNRDINNPYSFVGQNCRVLGWREITDSVSNTTSSVLQQLSLPILSDAHCQNLTGFVQSNDVRFCAGGRQGVGTCTGDVGGPLLCQQADAKYYVHGVTSSDHISCGVGAIPSIFTSVGFPHINGWVRGVLS